MQSRRFALALMALATSVCVLAYEIGGHHFALLSIYLDKMTPPPQRDSASYLELFCAELPDLAMELDAVTQRQHVFNSNEWQWGLLGRCSGPTTRHMFTTHYYLHGLTGDMKKPKSQNTDEQLRGAVRLMVQRIDADLATDRLVRVCARGFAAHLLGDSFAHEQLHSPGTRYAPGTGHWKDNHDPDYLLTRELLQTQSGYADEWFNDAASILRDDKPPESLRDQANKVLSGQRELLDYDYGEGKLTAALIASAPVGWQAFDPELQKWRPSGMKGVFLQDKCDAQLAKAFARAEDRPLCAATWSYYLQRAVEAFEEHNIDPVANAGYGSCSAQGDELQHGE